MAITVTKLVEREPHQGKRVVEATLSFPNGTAADIDLATQLGINQVDEVWVELTNADADSVALTSALPAYTGGTDLTFDTTGALVVRVRFYGS